MRRKDEQKAEAIKASVLKLARQFGFQGISMSKIAKDCGISSSTIYTYYENKEAMINSIYHDLREKQHNSIYNSINDNMNAEEALRNIFIDYYKYIIANEDEYYFIRQFDSTQEYIEEMLLLHYNVKITDVISKYQKSGEVIDVDISIVHSLLAPPIERIAENYFANIKKLKDEEIHIVFDLIWKGIQS